MRLLITADLHFNHPRSQALARDLIAQMNRAGGDALLLVGDTASSDGDALERCLELFKIAGPKLIVAGNHELWTREDDSERLLRDVLPRRARSMGWQWLQDEPFSIDDKLAIVGSVGWYDYSFAEPSLGIPKRFYEQKVSPGAAERLPQFASLFERSDDIPPHARDIVARWNDGKFVKLNCSDEEFLDELIGELRAQLDELRSVPRVIAAIHHLPFRALLPPSHSAQWDFAKAYLGSEKMGQLLLEYPNVKDVFCGHSHFRAEATTGQIRAVNIGSGYRAKRFEIIDLS